MTHTQPLTQTADAVREYIDANLFDSVGLMVSGIDRRTFRRRRPGSARCRLVSRLLAAAPRDARGVLNAQTINAPEIERDNS